MRRPLIVLLMTSLMGVATAVPVAAGEGVNTPDPGAEQDFLSRINGERSSRGLDALRWHSQAGAVARAHSEDMADDGELRHNPNVGSQVSGWKALGENVGVGPSVSAIHGAFMGSSSHRANIVGNFTHVGIGVVERDGSLWVTEVFVTPQTGSGSSSSGSGSGTTETQPKARKQSSAAPLRRASAATRPSKSATARPVRAALASHVHPAPQPVSDPVGERTVAALERFASEEAATWPSACERWVC